MPFLCRSIAAGKSLSFGQSANHFLYASPTEDFVHAWGKGLEGQLGTGLTASSSSALWVDNLTLANACAGKDHSAFVDEQGAVWTVGDNFYGQLGDGTNTARLTVHCLVVDSFIVASIALRDFPLLQHLKRGRVIFIPCILIL
jgi:alpha-tubulin suppressor-like RCC1 family protein